MPVEILTKGDLQQKKAEIKGSSFDAKEFSIREQNGKTIKLYGKPCKPCSPGGCNPCSPCSPCRIM